MTELFGRRPLAMFWGPLAGFSASIFLLGSEPTISILNAALFALSAGVLVAFAPSAWQTILGRTPLNSQYSLVVGVHLSWLGTDIGRGWSIVWRLLGQPLWLTNSWIVALGLFFVGYGAIFHLYADEALAEARVPPKRLVRWGVVVACTIFTVIAGGYGVDRWTEAGWFDIKPLG